MAVDSEARSSGNSAIIIALVALVLVVGGAFAFFNGNHTTDVVGVPTSGATTIVNNPAPASPDVKIEVPSPPVVIGGGSTDSGSSGSPSSGSTGGSAGSSGTTKSGG